jgi:hypothetical protein
VSAAGRDSCRFAEAVEELAEATGLRIRYVRVSSERDAALLAGHDVPEELVVRLRRVIDRLVDGRDARLTRGVVRAVGCEPSGDSDRSA